MWAYLCALRKVCVVWENRKEKFIAEGIKLTGK